MRIQIESTDEVTELNGVECRHWKGTTEKGVECHVFVHRVAVRDDRDSSQFEAELFEMEPARPVPLGQVLK